MQLYEKRKQAALEVELLAKELVAQDPEKVLELVDTVVHEYALSSQVGCWCLGGRLYLCVSGVGWGGVGGVAGMKGA